MKTVLKIIRYVVTFFLFCVFLLVLLQKITNNKVSVGNIYIFQVASNSMYPEYKSGDIIVVKKEPTNTLKVGDDVTYRGTKSDVSGLIITHRIVSSRIDGNDYYFTTKGIANEVEDPEISGNDIYGKVVYKTLIFSFAGRLMNNIVIYYLLFIFVGVSFAYEIISSFFIKEDKSDE